MEKKFSFRSILLLCTLAAAMIIGLPEVVYALATLAHMVPEKWKLVTYASGFTALMLAFAVAVKCSIITVLLKNTSHPLRNERRAAVNLRLGLLAGIIAPSFVTGFISLVGISSAIIYSIPGDWQLLSSTSNFTATLLTFAVLVQCSIVDQLL